MQEIEPPTHLTTIATRQWDHILSRADDGRYFLEVMCGSVAYYQVTLMLTDEQVAAMEADPTFIARLSRTVFTYPDRFSEVSVDVGLLGGVERVGTPTDDSSMTQEPDRKLLPKPARD